jgi:hypothetical protein
MGCEDGEESREGAEGSSAIVEMKKMYYLCGVISQ